MTYFVSPFNALHRFNRDLNHCFDAKPLDEPAATAAWAPRVDISETEEAFRVVADVPGVAPEDMEISLHKGLLTIRGERRTDRETSEGNFTRRERLRGSFSRQFNLPDSADEATVSAKSVHGVLEITIPKAPDAARKIIRVN